MVDLALVERYRTEDFVRLRATTAILLVDTQPVFMGAWVQVHAPQSLVL